MSSSNFTVLASQANYFSAKEIASDSTAMSTSLNSSALVYRSGQAGYEGHVCGQLCSFNPEAETGAGGSGSGSGCGFTCATAVASTAAFSPHCIFQFGLPLNQVVWTWVGEAYSTSHCQARY